MHEIDYSAIGMRIREARKAKKWSQGKLAKQCGISMSFIGHIERGTRIMSLETFVNVCLVLGVDADELLWDDGYPADSHQAQMDGHLENDDRYAKYLKIMKSVAEIMNES